MLGKPRDPARPHIARDGTVSFLKGRRLKPFLSTAEQELYLADSQPLLTALSSAAELPEEERVKRVEADIPLWRLHRDGYLRRQWQPSSQQYAYLPTEKCHSAYGAPREGEPLADYLHRIVKERRR